MSFASSVYVIAMPRSARTGMSCLARSAGLWCPRSPRKRALISFCWGAPSTRPGGPSLRARRRRAKASSVFMESPGSISRLSRKPVGAKQGDVERGFLARGDLGDELSGDGPERHPDHRVAGGEDQVVEPPWAPEDRKPVGRAGTEAAPDLEF